MKLPILSRQYIDLTVSADQSSSTDINNDQPNTPDKSLPKVDSSSLPPWLSVAKGFLGLEEAPGAADNDTIVGWASEIGGDVNWYNHDSIPWCGLFASLCMFRCKIDPPEKPLSALNWKEFGDELKEPCLGAVMVFKRVGGGHVAFYVSEDDDSYHLLGGNQHDCVCIGKHDKDSLVSIRWPSGYDQYKGSGPIIKEFDGEEMTSEQQQ